jgi:hypothetical protein
MPVTQVFMDPPEEEHIVRGCPANPIAMPTPPTSPVAATAASVFSSDGGRPGIEPLRLAGERLLLLRVRG